MRIDKFLWSVRIYKTRTGATEACRKGRVSINGSTVKPSKECNSNDEVLVVKKAITFSYKIIDIPKNRVGAKLVEDHVLDQTSEGELKKLEMIKLGKPIVSSVKRKFKGRPTKKERRDQDKFKQEDEQDPVN